MMAAAALSHRKVPIRLMCTTRVKKSPAMGPFLPSTRPAPMTPAQFTSRLMPPMPARAVSMAAFTSVFGGDVALGEAGVGAESPQPRLPGPSCTSNKVTRPPADDDMPRDGQAQTRGAAGDDGARVSNFHGVESSSGVARTRTA